MTNNNNFFHAYVVAGHKNDARDFVTGFLKEKKINIENKQDLTVSEHVIFTIDHVRELRAWQNLAPVGERKIFVTYITFITKEAENALLKTLEEPVPNTHIIIAIPKPEMLLPTLLSRVQVLVPEISEKDGIRRIKNFLSMTISERMDFVKKMIEKGDDEFASAEVREKAVAFFDDLENYFSKNISGQNKSSAKKIESILKLKRYLYSPQSSARNIMETLALTL